MSILHPSEPLPYLSEEPSVGVVVAKQQPVFAPACKHPVRFIGPLGHKVVYETM